MENEKKNPMPSEGSASPKKQRPNHRRGYFIEPNPKGEAPSSSAPPILSNAGSTPKKERTERTNASAQPANRKEANAEDANKPSSKNHRRNRPKNHTPRPAADNNRQNASQPPRQTPPKKGNAEKEHHTAISQTEPPAKRKNNRVPSSEKRPSPSAKKETWESLNESEYEEVSFAAEEPFSAFQNKKERKAAEETKATLVEVVGIRFKSTGKVYYFSPGGNTVRRGEHAIVETARGQEYGEVAMGNTMVKESDTVPPLRPILRVADKEDRAHHEANKAKEEEAFRVCHEKIRSHGLDMKLIDTQYTFDNAKLIFYFTSSGRVDFRDLVKDLASVFRTRIELRQIGIRDEAKLMGGMGMCGRPLCCTLFLSDFGQVSIKMAKEQNLSLNSAKISGICGRLMCCLRYEHETYEYEIKRTPPVDSLVRTADGNGVVTEIAPLAGTVKVRLLASPDVPPKVYKREDVTMLQKKKNEPKTENQNQ